MPSNTLEWFALMFFASGTFLFIGAIISGMMFLSSYFKADNGRHSKDDLYDSQEEDPVNTPPGGFKKPFVSDTREARRHLADLVRQEPTTYKVERIDEPETETFRMPNYGPYRRSSLKDPAQTQFFSPDDGEGLPRDV